MNDQQSLTVLARKLLSADAKYVRGEDLPLVVAVVSAARIAVREARQQMKCENSSAGRIARVVVCSCWADDSSDLGRATQKGNNA
jgi:hypothetical protein